MDLVLRTTVIFLLILLVTRVSGRRELSSLEPFDLILLIVIGDLVQQGITQSDQSMTGTIIVVTTLTLLSMGVSWLSYRFRRIRHVTEGEPIVLVQDGKLIKENLRRERITENDIAEEARGQQIANIEDIKWAILETAGTISCIPK